MKSKILVIEDERSIRNNLIKFLEAEGFEAIEAENGRIGIEIAEYKLPDLIICDILMPELDGYEVLTYLQENPKTATIPFIFLTVSNNISDLRQSMELGADGYLNKPITSDKLRNAIARRLNKQKNLAEQYAKESENIQCFNKKIQQLEQLVTAKDNLLNQISERLKKPLIKINYLIETLKNAQVLEEKEDNLEELQKEFAGILAIINEVSELQKFITPENAKLLSQFNFINKDE